MYLLLILTSIGFHRFCSSTYEYVCPTALNWQIRSIALCTNTEKYSCLRDENKDNYREICRKTPSMLAPGNKYVIKGNLDGEDCNGHRYQPFIFQTSKNSECAIKKSSCNEAGQIMFSNGSTTEDKSCRCDYSKRYAPIQKHSNPCYCVPSKEDCSCYLKLCPAKTHLSSEYTCVSDYTLVTRDYCGQIALSGYENSNRIFVIGNAEEKEDKVILVSYKFDEIFLVARITGITVLAVLAGVLSAAFLVIISGLFSNNDNQLNVQQPTSNQPTQDDNREINGLFSNDDNHLNVQQQTSNQPAHGDKKEIIDLQGKSEDTSPDKGTGLFSNNDNQLNVQQPTSNQPTHDDNREINGLFSNDDNKLNVQQPTSNQPTHDDKREINGLFSNDDNHLNVQQQTSNQPAHGDKREIIDLQGKSEDTSPDKGTAKVTVWRPASESAIYPKNHDNGSEDIKKMNPCESDNDTYIAEGSADMKKMNPCESDNDTYIVEGSADMKKKYQCESDNNASFVEAFITQTTKTLTQTTKTLTQTTKNAVGFVWNALSYPFSPSSKNAEKEDDCDDQSNASV